MFKPSLYGNNPFSPPIILNTDLVNSNRPLNRDIMGMVDNS
jgi:hypothetical protein